MTHVLLLRGINVGKAKRVAMADLRALVESLGCTDVQTLLNSGNVVCSTSKKGDLAARVRARGHVSLLHFSGPVRFAAGLGDSEKVKK